MRAIVMYRRWLRRKFRRARIKKGLLTDRDRWIYIRTSYTNESNEAFYGGEYDKLLADKRVSQLVISEDEGIRLFTVPIIKVLFLGGVQHCVYLGTYEVHVHLAPYSVLFGSLTILSTTNFRVHCLQSGRYDGALQTTYPIAAEHNFCFGVRKAYIEELANTGELYTFFNLVLDSLWHINPVHKEGIIRDFRKVNGNLEIEPYGSSYESECTYELGEC